MSTSAIVAFAAAAFLLNISPGPSILYVMSTSISSGRKAGVAGAFGLATGSASWAVLSALGVSAVIASSEIAFSALRYVGAAYLLYLGINSLRSPPFRVAQSTGDRRTSALRSYGQGFVVEGTNPKTVTFYLALVPQVLATFKDASTVGLIALCLIVPLTALPIDVTVSVTGGTIARTISRRPNVGRVLNYVTSAVLIGLGVLVLWE